MSEKRKTAHELYIAEAEDRSRTVYSRCRDTENLKAHVLTQGAPNPGNTQYVITPRIDVPESMLLLHVVV